MKTGLYGGAISQLRRMGSKGIIDRVMMSFLMEKVVDGRNYAKEAPILVSKETVHAVEGL